MPDTLGDRMKRYENVSRTQLTNRMPVIVRVDGRAFHTFTKGFLPFDLVLQRSMVDAAKKVAEEMQGFEVAYHQSDEVSFLLTDYAEFETSAWFDYVTQKVCTIAASVMTAWFNRFVQNGVIEFSTSDIEKKRRDSVWENYQQGDLRKMAYFDARAFNVPKEDVANYFLWRCKDWERNSLQMYCRQFFSSKQMHGQGRADQHEMLHKQGKNWATDVSPEFRNGTFILKDSVTSDVRADFAEIAKLVEPLVYKLQTVKADDTQKLGVPESLGDTLRKIGHDLGGPTDLNYA